MRLFVGNIPFDTSDQSLRALFEMYGKVDSAVHLADRETNRPRGYGFVEMPNQAEAMLAIKELHKTDFRGRYINVSEARPQAHHQPDPARRVQQHWTDRD